MKTKRTRYVSDTDFSGFPSAAESRAPSGVRQIVFLLIATLAAVSCSKTRIIPDEKLALIFHDAYLVNSYTQTRNLNLDSLNIYEPVFARYGYTTEDVQYTIGNFTKRKSARLSDVVDRSIQMLADESRFYQQRIAVHDTIGRWARERSARVVYTDTVISVRTVADTARLRVEIPLQEPGIYDVSYFYTVDTVDQNSNIRVTHFLVDERNRQTSATPRRLNRGKREKFSASFNAGDEHRRLVLNLNGYPQDLTRPSMRIDSLVVTYYLPDNPARAAMVDEWLGYRSRDTLSRFPRMEPGEVPVNYVFLPDERIHTENILPLPADSAGPSAR